MAPPVMPECTALTVDLEPDWGIRGTRAFREVTPRFLRFLEDRGMRATFFVVSDLMDVGTDLVRELARRHEVGSHGRGHCLLGRASPEQARSEIVESRVRLRESGAEVLGFRAPFFQRGARHEQTVAEAGYSYDASLGTVWPGPHNWLLGRKPMPVPGGAVRQVATSAMGFGLLPMSLTWLRVFGPLSGATVPRCPKVVYLHLHEFLPAETASDLSPLLRPVLTRNCGEAAWDLLDRALDRMDGPVTTCARALGLEGGGGPMTENENEDSDD